MRSAAKRNCRKSQREAARERRQRDPEPATEDEDLEVAFPHIQLVMELQESPLSSPPVSPASPGELDYGVVLDMVQNINNRLGDMNLDTERIRSVCNGLLRDYRDRDEVIGNLTRLVKETLDRPTSHQPHRDAVTPNPIVRPDLIDDKGNLRAADIGITWQGSDTFLHRRQGSWTECCGTSSTTSTGDVDALRTGAGTCLVSHVNTTTGTTVVLGGH